MINSATQYPLSAIFDIERPVKYTIPKYQREYTWGKEQCNQLFDDIVDNEAGYFLGTIICVSENKDALAINPLEVIDGQQRLTTISLLYACIYQKISKEGRTDEESVTERSNLKYRLIQKLDKSTPKMQLSMQNDNDIDYLSILREAGLLPAAGSPRPAYIHSRKLHRAFQHLKTKIANMSYDQALELLVKINGIFVVKIEVANYADAYTLFESLNNRGVPLSAMDLIKNRILSRLERTDGQEAMDSAYNQWISLVTKLPDYGIQERFLRQYYNAFRYRNEIKLPDYPRATRSTIINIYSKLVDNNPKLIFNELVAKSEIYNSLISPKGAGFDSRIENGLTDLINVEAAPAYTLLMYLFSKHRSDENLLAESIDFLVKYFTRRNLTDYPQTRELDGIFSGLIAECEANNGPLSASFIIGFLTQRKRFSTLETFLEKLRGDAYDENADVTRFILCKLEERHQTRETRKDLWLKRNGAAYYWTIEHIFPEGKRLPIDWVNMIAGGDARLASKYQDEYTHKLGNLTLTAYNSSLSNFSFEKKRDRKDDKGDYIGYRNGLYLNSDLVGKPSWTIQDIEIRTQALISEAIEIFGVENEPPAEDHSFGDKNKPERVGGRNPPWEEVELILALALYFQLDFAHNNSAIGQNNPDIVGLSKNLNKMLLHSHDSRGENFRSPDGVYMKLSNFLSLDPAYGKKGLPAVSQLDKQVWDYYSKNLEELGRKAAILKNGLDT